MKEDKIGKHEVRLFVTQMLLAIAAMRKTGKVPNLFELEAMTYDAKMLLESINWNEPIV